VEQFAPVRPSITALEQTQDRAKEKALFRRLGIPVPPYELVQTDAELTAALEKLNSPCILKTRRMGYDGKGQKKIDTADDAAQALAEFSGKECILERRVAFDRELSIIAAKGENGGIGYYNLVENHHTEGILRTTISPAPNVSQTLQSVAESYAKRMLEALNYSGVLAIELFQVGEELLANEFAPRVHNSGHWSIEGAVTSQFENHLRAVCGMPLGSTANRYRCVMTNIIGEASGVPEPNEKRFVHMYGKQPRPGRKIGHITEIVERYQ
jgi:5-(carboxyamino)imidazole ribonucleotide synthase